ncbi:Rha family transcriptional regulator, partial [Clostridium saudiense]|uniref:Rha family transcriptional regulator n=1 Tax=Clostridium saudiense TaxID=1414720 RepID=UPI0018AA4304
MENINIKNEEVLVKRNSQGELVVTSRQVAEDFEKDHRVVVRAIENKVLSLTEQNCSVEKLFIPSTYNHNGNEYKEYLLTRDGFTFIVMGFTGAKADTWKLKYIEAFNRMEEAIKNPYSHLSKELQAIFTLDIEQQRIKSDV